MYRRLPFQTRAYLIKMVTFWVIEAHPDRFSLTLNEIALVPSPIDQVGAAQY